jgi:signal peptidase I
MTVLSTFVALLTIGCAAGCTFCCAAVTAVRRRYLLVTVRGSSMCPTYDDADRILVRRTLSVRLSGPGRGEVVVLCPPVAEMARISPLLVKRVAAVPGDEVPPDFRRAVPCTIVPPGRLLVRGDNDHSADSRGFGLVDVGLVVGTVVRRRRSRVTDSAQALARTAPQPTGRARPPAQRTWL